jgi:glucose uptake protein
MKFGFILWISISAVIFVSAATASRLYASTSNLVWILLSLGLYAIGNLIMVKLMREGGLGLAISISSIAQLVLANLIAFGFFHEKLSPVQMGGIALGLVAVTLMMWPQQSGA